MILEPLFWRLLLVQPNLQVPVLRWHVVENTLQFVLVFGERAVEDTLQFVLVVVQALLLAAWGFSA